MAITNGYLTTTEAREYIGANESTDTEGLLDDVVTSVSRMIDRYCGRHFYQVAAGTRVFDSHDGYCVTFGPFNDLSAITTLKYDDNDDGTYEVTVSASNYQLLPVNAANEGPVAKPWTGVQLLNQERFPTYPASGRVGLVQIVGTWGWPAVPAEVKQAARILVAEVFKLQDAPLGVAGFGEFGALRVGRQLPARAADLLAPFRHPLNVGLA